MAFLVVIVTWFLSTGGLPRQCEHWLAMTAYLYKHQFVAAMWSPDFMGYLNYQLLKSGGIENERPHVL